MGVKHKLLQSTYKIREDRITEFQKKFVNAKMQIIKAQQRGDRIIFVDESKFSANTVIKKGFAHKYQSCEPPFIIQKPQVVNLIVGISFENGLEGYLMTKKEVNSTIFLKILDIFD